jgi:GNAT superfamily N-acetyltransferase
MIRPATIDDVPLILIFIRGIAAYEKLSHQVEATELKLRETLFGEIKRAEVILAFDKDIPVGFALFFHNYSTFRAMPGISLEDLFVEIEYRGKGFGKALLNEIISIAKQRNCGRVEWSVLDWNTPAIDFYKNMGAEPMEGWTTFRMTI